MTMMMKRNTKDSIQPIVTDLNKLRSISSEVKSNEMDEIIMLYPKMLQIMQDVKGIGLAAPQINIKKRFFVYTDSNNNTHLCINPRIIYKMPLYKTIETESCLSLPSFSKTIKRNNIIRVEYLDKNKDKITVDLTDRDARIFQHEYDHLNGKLLIDYT